MTGAGRRGAILSTLAWLAAASPQADAPGPVHAEPLPRYAIALEPGEMRRQASVAAEEILAFEAGDIFSYHGEATDAFGRTWHVVGDPAAWQRQQRWIGLPEDIDVAAVSGAVAALTALPPPPAGSGDGDRPRSTPVPVTSRWWDQTTSVPAAEIADFGERLGLPAWDVPETVADEIIRLIGGLEALGPWPQDAAAGRLHVPDLLPLVMIHDGAGWRPLRPARALQPVLGVLGNARLLIDDAAPLEASGPQMACWQLVGGIDPRGVVVGRVSVAPPVGAAPAAAPRRPEERFLGAFDLTPRVGLVADPAVVAPRRLAPPVSASGVLVDDASRRQAVYLEQRLPASITRALRGRSLTLEVVVRAPPEVEGAAATATPGIEIVSGDVRETVSGPVGSLPGRLAVTIVVPADADEIVIRLLPVDRSIAVQEAGRAIFDAAHLAPTEWPRRLVPAAVIVRRARVELYVPARRYARAAFAVSDRPAASLRRAWEASGQEELDVATRAQVLARELAAGMSPAAVRLAWGDPDRVDDGDITRWHWGDRSASFEGGAVLAWNRAAKRRSPPPARCPGTVSAR